MKRWFLVAACASLASLAFCADESAPKPDKFYLVLVTDFDGSDTAQVLNSAEFKKLNDDIRVEARVFAKAMALAEKDWKADESTKTKPFPRGGIRQRSFILKDQNTKQKVMDDALSAIEERMAEKTKAKEDREAKRQKQNATTAAVKEKDKDNQRRQDDRELMERRGRDLFKSKLEELKTAALQTKEAASAKPEAPKEKPAPEAPAKH